MWLSLVERCVRDAEAEGSNPFIPTTSLKLDTIRALGFVPRACFAACGRTKSYI